MPDVYQHSSFFSPFAWPLRVDANTDIVTFRNDVLLVRPWCIDGRKRRACRHECFAVAPHIGIFRTVPNQRS